MALDHSFDWRSGGAGNNIIDLIEPLFGRNAETFESVTLFVLVWVIVEGIFIILLTQAS